MSERSTASGLGRVELTELGGVPLVTMVGELDIACAALLEKMLASARRRDPRVLVDLGPCGFVDSTVISLLWHAARDCAEDGGALALVVPRRPPSVYVRDLLEQCGLARVTVFVEEVEEALAGLATPAAALGGGGVG
jgi:anti-anti-sigma factor